MPIESLSHPVALAAVHSLLLLPLFVGFVDGPCFIMQYKLISFAIISLLKMKELVAIR